MRPSIINFDDIPIDLDDDMVRRHPACRGSTLIMPGIETRLRTLIDEVRNEFQPVAMIGLFPVGEIEKREPALSRLLSDPLLLNLLPHARVMAIAVVTIGAAVDRRSAALYAKKELLKAALLDAIGNAALACATTKAEEKIAAWAAGCDLACSSRIQPGVSRVPLGFQQIIFDLLPVRNIRVKLHGGEVMRPRKSLSFIQGIGKSMPVWKKSDICRQCKDSSTCQFS
jgi:hypothetical protein